MSFCNDKNASVVIFTKGFSQSMLRFLLSFCACLICLSLAAPDARATSTQYGDTGLISQPTAQTLDAGNICFGVWTNCSDGVKSPGLSTESSVIVPATLTMGLGTFMEAYGSYPNLLFNDDEYDSGRGSANAGF